MVTNVLIQMHEIKFTSPPLPLKGVGTGIPISLSGFGLKFMIDEF
jgi:hypothetical protein